MIQTRPRAVVLSLFAVLTFSAAIGVGCSGGGGDDDDDDDGTTQTPGCTPLPNNNLSTIQQFVFTPQCSGSLSSCHDSVAPAGNLDLSDAATSRAEMLGVLSDGTFNAANIAIVDSGNSGASFLYLKVTGANGISGTAMPATGQALCAEKVNAIEAWIDAGAPDN